MNNYKCETAVQAVANIKAGWNLGNTLDATNRSRNGETLTRESSIADYETAWGNPITTKEMIETVVNAGFDAIRLPVTWQGHFDENYNIDKVWMDRVQEVVDYVIPLGVYCILNVHHDGGTGGWIHTSKETYEKNGDGFARVWEQIADRFESYGEKLLFEAVNEPLDETGNWGSRDSAHYEGVMLYNQRFVDIVRSRGGYNKTRNLAVMPYAGAHGNHRVAGIEMPKDSVEGHLILQVHNYDPMGFCWLKSEKPLRDWWGSDEDYEEVNTDMRDLAEHGKRMGVPVIVGEFGCENKNNDAEIAKYARHFVKTAASHGIKCFWWDCGHFALLDRENCKMIHTDVVKALTEYDK